MADREEVLEFKLIHGAAKHTVSLPLNKDEGPTVETLAEIAEELTKVPRDHQKIIFKGKSLQDKSQSLAAVGIKNGSKVMLIGKKYDPEVDDNMKALRAAEQQAEENKKKLESFIQELDGIQNGFLQKDLIEKAVIKISKQIQYLEENLMKILESLDSLSLGSSTLEIKGKRKSLVKFIQDLITEADIQKARCEALQKGKDL